MTEETIPTEIEEVFKLLNISTILVAAIKTLGEIRVPAKLFTEMAQGDRDLKVDLIDGQTFVFTLKENDEQQLSNDELASNIE